MNKREVLAATSFGKRIAEDEADDLVSYFVETEQWRRLIAGEVDVIYGPKGAGKSALYSLLRQKKDELHETGIIPVSGETRSLKIWYWTRRPPKNNFADFGNFIFSV